MPSKESPTALAPVEMVQRRILIIRGQRVIIDADLATLYAVSTKRLNEQVKRNIGRFPPDFYVQTLRGGEKRGGRKLRPPPSLKFSPKLPYAFTEHGAIMAATVLNSPQAVSASLFVVRAFVKLRELLATHHQLAIKLDELERKLQDHDEEFIEVFDAIRDLMDEKDDPPKPPAGFAAEAAGHKLARRTGRRAAGSHG